MKLGLQHTCVLIYTFFNQSYIMPNFVCVQTYLWVCRAHVQSHEDLTLSFLNAYYDASAVTRMNTQVYVRVRTVCIQVHKLSHV